MKIVSMILVLMCSSFTYTFAQQAQNIHKPDTQFKIERMLEFELSSDVTKIPLNVKANSHELEIHVRSDISEGNMTVQILDPSGEDQGQFTVGTMETGSKVKEIVQGNIRKQLQYPDPGNWTIVIKPSKATAQVKIMSMIYE